MYKLHAYFTDDGSVGLYSPDDNDIYHSIYGALSEAYEKFIIPANLQKIFKSNNEIKILDICYGIGYNTKSFLNEYIKFYYNESIYTDNIQKYNCKIDTDNICPKLYIHAIDIDKNLVLLSPFFKTNKKITSNNINFDKNKLIKNLSKILHSKYKLNKIVNYILINKLYDMFDSEFDSLLFDRNNSVYFDKNCMAFYSGLKFINDKIIPDNKLLAFLHNIYYKYISTRHKSALNSLQMFDFNFDINIDDARNAIKHDNNLYNIIFLDAFSPDKCPCLWTLDFFKELYKHLDDKGIILTYSNSARIRNAFLNDGFYIGRNVVNEKSCGTVACKNKSLIVNELSECDLGLLKTKAGIFYRDENLNASNEDIIVRHKTEVSESNLMSSTKYLKSLK